MSVGSKAGICDAGFRESGCKFVLLGRENAIFHAPQRQKSHPWLEEFREHFCLKLCLRPRYETGATSDKFVFALNQER